MTKNYYELENNIIGTGISNFAQNSFSNATIYLFFQIKNNTKFHHLYINAFFQIGNFKCIIISTIIIGLAIHITK